MIKCIGYLRSLKQLLSILLISCFIFGLGSFASATIQDVGVNSYPSSVNSGFDISFLKGGGLLTTYLGQDKSILALRNNVFMWWSSNGFPYFYLDSSFVPYFGLYQGFPDRYFICDEIVNGQNNLPGNCVESQVWDYSGDNNEIKNNFQSFFKKVNTNDYVYYNYVDFNWEVYLQICWSSNEIGKSLCFKVGKDNGYISGNSVYNNAFLPVNSQNLSGLTFGTINNSWIGYAPGQAGYIGGWISEGSSSIEITIGLTGDYSYSTCTQGEILGMLENQGFSKYMCYGGLDNFDLWSSTGSYSPVPGYGKRLSQILSYSSAWDSPQEWFEYWNGLYQDKDNPLYYSMWESYPAVYRTWFDMYSKYGNGKYFDSIREYCVMKVDLNLSPDIVYKGTQFKGVCDTIIDIKQNPGSYTTDSGGKIVGVNWVGVGQLSGSNKTATQFIQDFFNTIKAQINTNYDGPGFIPAYIILFMLALIFFRFISH